MAGEVVSLNGEIQNYAVPFRLARTMLALTHLRASDTL